MLLINYQNIPKVNDVKITFVGEEYLGIINCNYQWEYCYLNKEAELLLGKTTKELRGKKIWSDFLDLGERLNFECHKALSEQKPVKFEFFSQQINSWLEVRIYPQEYHTLSIYIIDLSNFKFRETQFQEKEDQLQTQYDNFPIPTYTWKKQEDDFILINYNKAAQTITKENISSLLESKLSRMYADSPEIIQEMHQCYNFQTTLKKEMSYTMRTTGETKYFLVTYVYVPPDLVMVHTEDITENKTLFNQLQDKEKSYYTLTEFSPVGIFRTNMEGNCLYVNSQWLEFSGLTQEEAYHSGWIQALHPEDRDWVVKKWYETVENNQFPFTGEYRFQTKSGKTTWVFGQAIIECDQHGTPQGYLGTLTDITERKQREEEANLLQLLTSGISEVPDLNSVISLLSCNFCQLTDWDFGEVWIPDYSENVLRLSKNCSSCYKFRDHDICSEEISFSQGVGLPGKIWQSQQPQWYDNLSNFSSVSESCSHLQNLTNQGVKACLGIPLIANNQLIAVIIVYSYTPIQNHFKMIDLVIKSCSQLQSLIERKQLEEQKRASEELYRLIVNASSEGILLVDEENIINFVNKKMTKMLGYSFEEFIGKNIFNFIEKNVKNLGICDWEEMEASEQIALENDFQLRCKDGSSVWVILSANPLFKPSGKFEGLLIMVTDISQRKKAELSLKNLSKNLGNLVKQKTAQLQKNEQFFRRIFEQAAVGICLSEPTGQLINANDYFYELIGYQTYEVKGKSLLEFVEPYSRRQHLQYINDLLNGKIEHFSIESRYLNKNGQPQWVYVTASLLKNEQGKPLYILTITKNIQEQKEMEEKLRQSEEKYQTLFEILPVGVSVTDAHGNFIEANKTSETLLGVSITEHIQRSLFDPQWQTITPHNTPMPPSEYPAVRAIQEQRTIKNTEMGVVKPDGKVTWLSVNASPIPLNNYGAVIAYTDITERKKIEQMKDEFVSITSHELRTPLTSIKASLDLLSTGKLGTLTLKGEKVLGFARSDTQRLERLINDILEHQRLRFGNQVLQYEDCPVNTIIQQAWNIIEPLAVQNKVNVSISSLDCTVTADGDRLVQVLTNLLYNAIKFSESESKIWLRVFQQENQVLFEVEDQGIGIPQDKLEIIFEPFRQVDNSSSRGYEGSGLGLAICKSIIIAHGGKIGVESELGVGSKFYFTIPLNYSQ
jgi:PAS domain S-box-containing protein